MVGIELQYLPSLTNKQTFCPVQGMVFLVQQFLTLEDQIHVSFITKTNSELNLHIQCTRNTSLIMKCSTQYHSILVKPGT